MGDYGINNSLEYVELCLDSSIAQGSGNNGFINGSTQSVLTPSRYIKYSWPNFSFTSKKFVVAALKILTAEIPFIWDVISTGNNRFVYDNGTARSIVITPGTYTGPQLATELQTRIQVFTPGFTVTWNSSLLKFVFVDPINNNFSMTFADINTPCRVMGFFPGLTVTAGFTGTIVSPAIAQVTGPYFLYLNSRKLGSLINVNTPDGTQVENTILCRIPVTVNYGSIIFYNDHTDKYLDFFIGNQFDNFDMYLTLGSDGYQLPLDMKGATWSVKMGMLIYRTATSDLYEKPSRSGITTIRN